MGNKKKVLIVVDVQNDFVTGSLGTPEAQAIVPKIKEKFEEYKNNGDYVVYTMDTHNSDYLNTSEGKKLPVEHCIYRTSGWEVIDEIHPVKNNYNNFMVCKKSTFGYEGWDWEEIFGTDSDIDNLNIEIIGVCTDICVITNALLIKTYYIDNILPACKKEIMQHNGKLLVRPDSGDMVEISVKTIEKLWNTFEGSVNSKGYKVLDPHIGIIYGDGCTLNNVKKVWEELEKKGFAANNIVFGVGAFCFSAVVEPDGRMVVVTRDMFGIAMKATFGEVNGQPIMIYKDPKTDVSHLKKSHKGCCHVYYDENGELRCRDGYDSFVYDGALKTVFKDGEIYHTEIFKEIRDRLNGRNKDE